MAKKKRVGKLPIAKLVTETSTMVKEATQGATVVARSATKRCDAPDRCVAFAADRVIRGKYVPTSSPSSPARLTRVAATLTGVSADKSRAPSSAMHHASFSTSLVKGVEMRTLGRSGISR